MNNLPASIRRNLVQKSAVRKNKRWSLASLAAMNQQEGGIILRQQHQQQQQDPAISTSTSTAEEASSSSANVNSPKDPRMQKATRLPVPPSHVAKTLLNEVNVRLASQHKKCQTLMDQINSISSSSSSSSTTNAFSSSSTTATTNQNLSNNAPPPRRKVISAVNQAVPMRGMTMQQWMERLQQMQQGKEKVLKILHNLEILHMDTFALTQHLISNENEHENDNGDENDDSHHHHQKKNNNNKWSKPRSRPLERFSKADKDLIAATFEQIRSRHAATVENMADVVIEMRNIDEHSHSTNNWSSLSPHAEERKEGDNDNDNDNPNTTLPAMPMKSSSPSLIVDEFLRDRLGIQLLCDHYVGLDKGKPGGGISVNCNFMDVLTDAILEAKSVCDANFGIAPEVHVMQQVPIFISEPFCAASVSASPSSDWDDDNRINETQHMDVNDVTITLIRPWVHHSLVELLKNGMTSNVQKGNILSQASFPPDMYIRLQIIHHPEEEEEDADAETVTVKSESTKRKKTLVCEILDQGIGLSSKDKEVERAFLFAESSSQRRWDRLDEQQSYAMVRAPIASLGVGLCLSRMMMRMFGGDVILECRDDALRLSSSGCCGSGGNGNGNGNGINHGDEDGGDVVIDAGCSASLHLPFEDDIVEDL